MNSIEEALTSGYGEDEVLDFISKKYPDIAKKITKALSSGYSPRNILNFISPIFQQKQKGKQLQGRSSQQEIHALNREEDVESNKRLAKTAAQVGLTAGGGLLARRALQNAPFGQIGKKIGQSLGFKGPKGVSQTPVAETLGADTGLGQAATQQGLEQAAKAIPKVPINELKVDFETLKLAPKIESLLANGKLPEVLGGILQKQISPEQQEELEKKYNKSFPELLKEYADNFLNKAEGSPLSQESLTHQRNQAKEEPIQVGTDKNNEVLENVENMELENENAQVPQNTSKMVALPDGRIGEIQDERQGIATIKTPDGKISRRKTDDLVHEPERVIKAVQDILEIPEASRSAAIAYTAYNPSSKKLYVMFHNGKTVEYDDFDEEDFNNISNGKMSAKTEGENIFGVWSPEDIEKSRGATFHNKIRINPKYSKENEDKTWRYLNEGFDYWQGLRKKAKRKKTKQ